MHTNVYYEEVNNLMSGVQSREEALEMLNYIREAWNKAHSRLKEES